MHVDVVARAVQAPAGKEHNTSPALAAQQARQTWGSGKGGPREGELRGVSPPMGQIWGKWGPNSSKRRVERVGSWSYWGCFGLWEIV